MNFKEISNGMLEGFALLKKCDIKSAKNGSEYLDLILGDSDGEISAKLWDCSNGDMYKKDMVVKVRGNEETYNGRAQFRINQIRPVSDSDSYNIADLVPASQYDGELLYNMIMNIVDNFSDNDFKVIVTDIMTSRKENLIKFPAALRLHHAIVGGLMLHTMSMLKMAESVAKIYKNVNSDLLFSGVILHDVAKTWELEANDLGLATGYTVSGELVGHLVKGAMFVEESAKKNNIKEEKAVLLEHMLLSHHGVPEYGSPIRPLFLESEILSSIDNLDAAIYEISTATSNTEVGGFSDRQWALDNRRLFNHGLSNPEYKVSYDD